MKTVKIDRSRWVRGNIGVFSQLKNGLGFMCCLGFHLNQIDNIPEKELEFKPTPDSLKKLTSLTCPIEEVSLDKSLIIDSNFATKAIELNDYQEITEEEREKELTELFKKNGYELIFEN